jgi:hypothetical protein
MQMPANTSAYLWGAFVGAFGLAPICAQRFREQNDDAAKTDALVKTSSSWDRGDIVEKSGFATMPGSKTADPDVARACAEILSTPALTKS